MIALLLLLATTLAPSAPRPNPTITPGLARPLTLSTICTTKWGKDVRKVTQAMKRHVAAAYGYPWEQRGLVEIDHLIPRDLGGADDIANLWAQPWAGEWGARKKDRLEVKLHTMVCSGSLPLRSAQEAIRKDWVAAYIAYVN